MSSLPPSPASQTPPVPAPVPPLPLPIFLAILARLFAVQGAWSYELLLGTGMGFCAEPALRQLAGGATGVPYHEALARQSRYFNAHPYMAAVAVGALTRSEVDGVPAAQIERFRTALCGPLGSVGDRLIWAGWLPFSALLGLTAFGAGAGPWLVVLIFLLVYNAGQIGLRVWGLRTGWRLGMRVASALGTPILRRGPIYIARANALLAGIALPLALVRVLDPGGGLLRAARAAAAAGSAAPPGISLAWLVTATLFGAAAGALLLVRGHGRFEGWRVALLVLGLYALTSVVR